MNASPGVEQRLAAVRERIARAEARFGRTPGTVQLLAASKTFPVECMVDAMLAGQWRFGENYLQEASRKIMDTRLAEHAIEWHFIGPLQGNKTRQIAALFDWVHSVDRLSSAEQLAAHRPPHLSPLNICVQINISGEASKGGINLEQLAALANRVAQLPPLRLRGLMAIPLPETDFERQRLPFRALRIALERLRESGLNLDTLSMGMSGDLEAAIAEGATLVRVGSAIFGQRGTADGG